jgi:hypothetical protein
MIRASKSGRGMTMSEELSNDDVFLVDFPVWLLLNWAAIKRTVPLSGVLFADNMRLGKFPLMFTDAHGAEEFRDSKPELSRYATARVNTPAEILAFLDAAEQRGSSYVAFDIRGRRARFVSIAHIRKTIRG